MRFNSSKEASQSTRDLGERQQVESRDVLPSSSPRVNLDRVTLEREYHELRMVSDTISSVNLSRRSYFTGNPQDGDSKFR